MDFNEHWRKWTLQTSRTFLNQNFPDQTSAPPKFTDRNFWGGACSASRREARHQILDMSGSQNMQFCMRNPNLRSKMNNFCVQKGKIRKNWGVACSASRREAGTRPPSRGAGHSSESSGAFLTKIGGSCSYGPPGSLLNRPGSKKKLRKSKFVRDYFFRKTRKN